MSVIDGSKENIYYTKGSQGSELARWCGVRGVVVVYGRVVVWCTWWCGTDCGIRGGVRSGVVSRGVMRLYHNSIVSMTCCTQIVVMATLVKAFIATN